jgi:hypothetical protein
VRLAVRLCPLSFAGRFEEETKDLVAEKSAELDNENYKKWVYNTWG